MHRLLVAGDDAAALAALIRARDLPALAVSDRADAAALAQTDILLGSPQAIAELLDGAPALRWVQSSWAGVEPLLQHRRRDYLLTGMRGIFGQPMSEYVLGWLLALERRVIERAQQRRWDARPERGVGGRRLGILGTGDIARAVARACTALGMVPVGLNSDGRAVADFTACYPASERLAFASGLDYLLGLLPGTPGTDDIVDAALLDQLTPGAIFINAGRANSVVDADLLAALAAGRLRAAVLDVTREEPLPGEHPFWQTENLYLSSHTAAPTQPQDVVDLFVDNYGRFRRGEPLAHVIDLARGY